MPEVIVRPATRREIRVDALVAFGLAIASCFSLVLSVMAGTFFGAPSELGLGIAFAVLVTVPLVARRRYPITVAVTVHLVYMVAAELGVIETFVSQVVLFLAFFTVGARVNDRRNANLARAGIAIAMALWLLITTFRVATNPEALGFPEPVEAPIPFGAQLTPVLAYLLMQWLINLAYFGGAWVLGDRSFAAATGRVILQRRTDELEDERELAQAQAITLDRVRIARELHDVVAHHVSAMGVQAGAARLTLERDPQRAARALSSVEESAREAVSELRHILETLRSNEAPETAADAPSTVSVERIGELVDLMNTVGTATKYQVIGDSRELPSLTSINLYRIAQEALTNARRHGGPDATADVRLRYNDDAVELEVTNTGRVVGALVPGLGTLGMRERATAIGGVLDSRPLDRGGFLVRVLVVDREPSIDG